MTELRHIVVLGDVILDGDLQGRVDRVCPDAPVPVVDVTELSQSPGGAGVTALRCRAPGVRVSLVAPLADDDDARLLTGMLTDAGVTVIGLDHAGPTRRKTRDRSAGQSLLRLDQGGPGVPVADLPAEAVTAVHEADVVLVSCYGAGTSGHPEVRELLTDRARTLPVMWDPHPRGGPPVPGCTVVTPNLTEARAALGAPADSAKALAERLRSHWQVDAVCVTASEHGAWVATSPRGARHHAPSATVHNGDPCGAGDRFAAAVAVGLAMRASTDDAVAAAVQHAASWVADGGTAGFRAAGFRHRERDFATEPAPPRGYGASSRAEQVLAAVRSRGGTLVATGGCFDILHPGHVQSLEAARRLGDALVVLLNSDASVHRLKGPGRPVQTAADRARVLLGLASVDAVVVFDEDDPRAALDRLRPAVWVKGGDYRESQLLEADLVRSWGGRIVLLPYLEGRSTTQILQGTADERTT